MFFDLKTPRLFTFELFLQNSQDPCLTEVYSVRTFLEAWCFVELLARDSRDPHGTIHVSDENGNLLIVTGASIALASIAHCKVKGCKLKELTLTQLDLREITPAP